MSEKDAMDLAFVRRTTEDLTAAGLYIVIHPSTMKSWPEEVKKMINENDCWVVKEKLG
jgi:hypothetical protein